MSKTKETDQVTDHKKGYKQPFTFVNEEKLKERERERE